MEIFRLWLIKKRNKIHMQNTKDKKIWNVSRICTSSLLRAHANLLCIVPVLVYVLLKRALISNFLFHNALPAQTSLITSSEHSNCTPSSNSEIRRTSQKSAGKAWGKLQKEGKGR